MSDLSLPKHRARAVEAIARHLCSVGMTDGFCGPRDGRCCETGADKNPRRDCMVRAEGCMRAMETVGVKVVWTHDPILKAGAHPDPITDAAERAVLGLP